MLGDVRKRVGSVTANQCGAPCHNHQLFVIDDAALVQTVLGATRMQHAAMLQGMLGNTQGGPAPVGVIGVAH
jgi:hypothetical protein